MAIVDSTSTCSFRNIQTIDLHRLSQSELHSLSLCSDAALNSRFSQDDVVIPKIDRNVFNESSGSRKQAYSRFRLAPSSSSSSSSSSTTTTTTIRRRTPHLRNLRPPPQTSVDDDPERAENSRIIHLLKELFAKESNGNDFLQVPVNDSNSAPVEVSNEVINPNKRKRGRPRKDKHAIVPVPLKVEGGTDVIKDIFYNENGEEREIDVAKDRDIVNKNGAFVDLVALGGLSDPYGPELRRRTAGMETAEELLGFLGGLNGQWGSRRKKRMVVDANDFGHVLPLSWKLLLALKRKEGNVWLICRRYISPTGRQFVSCKDISSYLLSICGTQRLADSGHGKEIIPFGNDTKDAVDLSIKEESEKENIVCPSLSPSTSGNGSNTNDVKNIEASRLNEEQNEPVVSVIVPQSEPLIQEPIEIETNSADIPDESLCNDEPSTDKFDHDLNCLPPDKHDFSHGNENVKMSAQESSDKDNYCDISIDEMCVVDDKALADMPVTIENSEIIVSNDQNQETVSEDTVFTCSKEQCNGSDDLNGVTIILPPESPNMDMVKCVDGHNLLGGSTTISVSPKVNEIFNFESNECGSYGGSDIDAMATLEEEKTFIENFGNEVSLQRPPVAEESDNGLISDTDFRMGPVISSWNNREPLIGNYGNNIPTQQKKAETNLISSLFDYEQSCSVEDYVVPSKFDEKEKSLFRSLVPSGIEQSFGGISDNQELSLAFGDPHGVKYTAVEDPKQERGSVGGLFSSLNDGFEDNLGSVYEVGNSGSSHTNNNNKFMMNFGSSEYVQPDNGDWRTGQGNMIQSGLAVMPNPLLQPSNTFCTFDLMSDKAQVYNSGFGGMRPNRSEPVEFSFLMAQNQNTSSLQNQNHNHNNINNNTHNQFRKTRMEREFDMPFWLGREALMPNIAGPSSSGIRRDQLSSICQWCRNPYLQEPVIFGAQSAVGPVCPTCRAKFSGSI